ncbi:MAG TPA: DUF2269 family protein [Gemmatimonadales bacterium]|nr:DUF2269 family protein [Gemmatimonadales bacterium]
MTWKALHVIGAVLMVGNVTVTGVWTILLWRDRADRTARHIARGILWTDLIFTFFGGAMMTIAGIMMVRQSYPAGAWKQVPWLMEGIRQLAISSGIWLLFLLPDQIRLERCPDDDLARFRKFFLRWSIVGWIATVFLYRGLWVMTTKPT